MKGVWSTLVVYPDDKIKGHLQPQYNTPIEGVWRNLVVFPYDKIIGQLQP